MIFGEAKRAVVTVGEGRGFVVECEHNRFVVTAAHCLPYFPPCMTASYTQERTYKTLLGPLGKKPSVWTECLFADPIGDIAVLGPPDNQKLANECALYDELIEMAESLEIADPPKKCPAWLLSLNGQWFRCTVQHNNGPLWISETAEAIIGGMSGSPIVADDGAAIGIMCTAGDDHDVYTHAPAGPNPRLTYNLPGWLLREASIF